MLNKLQIQNFKGIKKISINIKPVTILIGANGSGKSSIGQSLLVMKQSLSANHLECSGNLIQLGKMEDLFHNHDPQNYICFIFEGKSNKTTYRSQIIYDINRIKEFTHKYTSPWGSFEIEHNSNKNIELMIDDNLKVIIKPKRNFWNPFDLGPSPRTELLEKYNEVGEQLLTLRSQLNNDLNLIRHVPTIRGTMQPSHLLQGTSFKDFLRFKVLDERNRNLISTLAYEEDLLEKVSSWCQEILDAPLKFKLEPSQHVLLERIKNPKSELKKEKVAIRLVNEGFGLNQLIILLTQLALSPRNSIIIIEEPEIHLHPKAQIKLFEVLARETMAKGIKLIITTHSEHLVYQALTMVGLSELKKSELSLYHFYIEENVCSCKELIFDKNGRLSDSLPDFFDVNIEQYKRYIDILTKE